MERWRKTMDKERQGKIKECGSKEMGIAMMASGGKVEREAEICCEGKLFKKPKIVAMMFFKKYIF